MKHLANLSLLILILFNFGCEQPVDPIVKSVNETNSVLTKYIWTLTDYQVTVKNPDIPPPMLINASDSMIEAGDYHLPDMLPPGSDFPVYKFQFTGDNKIITDSANSGIFVDDGSTYFVFNDSQIRLVPDGAPKLVYRYQYNPEDNSMNFTLNADQASRAIDQINDRLIRQAVDETPDKIGAAISDILHKSPRIKRAIKNMIKHGIAGKLPGIFDFNLEHTAQMMSEKIRSHALDSLNWKQILKDAIKHELRNIHNHHDSLGSRMAREITLAIETQFTVDRIKQTVLPYLGGIELQEDPDAMAHLLATLIADILGDIFSEENLQKIIEPIWREFTKLDAERIDEIAGNLTEITQDNWLNVDTLTGVFLPYTKLIDSTSVLGLNALAQEATDSLEIFVDKLNATFDSLNLDPDYDNIESEIHAILIAAKPIIGTVGAEQVAQDIAQLLVDDFFTTDNIQSTFVAALDFLQTVSPETAAETIAQWIVNLEHKIAPEFIEWLTEKLSPILNNLNQGYTAYKISNKVHNYVKADFSADGIEPIIFPLLQDLRNLNGKSLAKHIAEALIKHKLAQEEADNDVVANIILQTLMNHGDNPDDPVSKQMVHTLQNKNLLRSGKTPELLEKIISFLLYRIAWDNFKIANNFEEVTMVIRHE